MFVPDVALLENYSARDDISDLSELIAFLKRDDIEGAVWPEDDDALPFSSVAYLDRFRERLATSGKFEPGEIESIMRHARGYAGGLASGQARRKVETDPLLDSLAAREGFMQMPYLADVTSIKMAEGALTSPWMQITPKSGAEFSHPRYGKVKFDKAFAEDMVRNFKGRVYQEHIPIDAEHDTKLSGALGYYRELRVRADGAVEAQVELTDRGVKLREGGGFKYFSPEFFRSWEDPATGNKYNNLLIGGAFTSRPFFKDQHLAPLAASEQYTVLHQGGTSMDIWQKDEEGALILDAEGNPQKTAEAIATDEAAAASNTNEKVEAAEVSAVVAFREAHNLNEDGTPRKAGDVSQSFSEQFPEEARRMREVEERNSALVADSRRRQFKEAVLGRDGVGDGSPAFLGDHDKHVKHLMSLSEKFGDDAEEVKWYVAQNREHAAQARSGSLFGENGSNATGAIGSADEQAETMAKELIKANPGMAMGEAMDAVLSEHPELYSESIN